MTWLHILFVVLGIGAMLFLNIKFKLNAMLALLIAALLIGFLEMAGINLGWLPPLGDNAVLNPQTLLKTIQTGFGSTLGSLAMIVVFGAVIGKLMVDSGAASQIAETLIAKFGIRYVKIAMVIAGMVFGLAMFYEVAFIILAPLIVAVAHEAKMPFMKLAIPAVAATTTAHSLFVPQPGPVALANAYGADVGMSYVLGLVVAIPTVFVTGWILPRFLGNLDYASPALLQADDEVPLDKRPSFGVSILLQLSNSLVGLAVVLLLSLFL
ncbi:GntT/GntP/DsdX family permease, partial [Nigerium massiliense]|uniref:GntT/GntP/DsdX family permease n=1 Tax=Nigerium massiliense TaxID=1522317 RepID=UPI0005905A60